MKNENLVPKVRFKGFSDPWEQRKLKNIAIRVRGNDGRMELPTLTISATQGWLNQKDRFSENIAGKEQKNYTLLKKGQLSYNHGNSKTAKYGAVFKLDIYTEALVPRVYHSFTVKHNNSADFIEYLFATGSPNRELRKLVSSGARMDGLLNISFDAFFNINLQVPIATEQMKIAKFFRKTDNLIAANEDKLEQLKTLKKLMMQKIFSQEWRFKGFTDPWEQRKLCQIATINPKSVISPHFLYVDLESVSQNRVTQYKAVTKDDAPSRAQRLAKKGDIFSKM
ncbi:restriction endonuclease subunit S [Lactiplantibacillus plantarum]|nr:restriction endonuclease subunit S [Lactiplantibacillus plantarum]